MFNFTPLSFVGIVFNKQSKVAILFAMLFAFGNLVGYAQTTGDYRSIAPGNWSTVGIWERYNGGWAAATDYPGQNSGTGLVTIQANQNILMDVSPANPINALTVKGASGTNTRLIFFTPVTLNVTGAVIIEAVTGGAASDRQINTLASGSQLNCASLNIQESNGDSRVSFLNVSDGTVTVSGNIAMGADPDRSLLQFSSGTLNIGGTISGGAIIPGTGTVNFNNNITNNIQTIPAYNYHNVTVSNAYSLNKKVLGASLAIGGDLTCNGGALYLENNSITLAAGKKCTINGNSKLILDGTGTIITTNGGNLLDMKSSSYLELKSATAQIPDFATYAIDNASRLNFNYAGNQPNLTLRGQSWGFTYFEASGTKTLTENLTCTSFDITSGVTLNTGTFNIINKPTGFTSQLFLEGTLTGTGKVIFNNNNVINIANTGGPFTFYDLEMNTATPNIVLSLRKDITVSHTLTLTQGKIFTEGNTLTLSNPTATDQLIGGSADSYVYSTGAGRLRRNHIGATPTHFPVGSKSTNTNIPKYYLPVSLSHSTGSGDYAINVFEGLTTDGVEGGPAFVDNKGVNATWNVDLVTGTTTGTVVGFEWVDALEGSAFSSLANNQIGISHYVGSWQMAQAATADQAANRALATFTSFSPFAVSMVNYILPVKFASAKAYEKQNGIQLDWKVANEENVKEYIIERSVDASVFKGVGTKTAIYHSALGGDYGFFDATPLAGTSYYRIKNVDADGKTTYSPIMKVTLGKAAKSLYVYPNPASNVVNISGTSAGQLLRLTDLSGKTLRQITAADGVTTVPVNQLPTGTYLLLANENGKWQNAGTVVKQ